MKLMEENTFSVFSSETEGSALELFIRKYCLAKMLLKNSDLSLYLVI